MPTDTPWNQQPEKEELLSMDEVFLNKLKDAIENNLEVRDFGVDELGKEIGMSRSQIHRKLQALKGKSASRYIRTYKLKKAEELLAKNVGTVSEISFRMGFSSPAYFGQVFQVEFGYSPSEASKRNQPFVDIEKEPAKTTRKLAAIMFTDIVQYSALMGTNEDKALNLLRKNREIHIPLIETYNGKVLKELGDGFLAQFESVYDCVKCAIEIQIMSEDDLHNMLRVGIHLGDITTESDDVFGDGVNIASRLQEIADPGGIYISESIQRTIRGRSDIQVKYIGEIKLKNIDFLLGTYCIQGPGLPEPQTEKVQELTGTHLQVPGTYVAKINDNLIQEVFNEFVKVKPSFARFLVEDEDDEEIDLRLIADQIIRNFPWIIGVELRRLFSGSMRTIERTRLAQLYKAVERSLQFLCYLIVIELYEQVKNKKLTLDKTFVQEFKNRFSDLSIDNVAWMIKSIGGIFQKESSECFFPELSEILSKDLYDHLNFDLPEKDARGKFIIKLSEEEILRECVIVLDLLTFLLKKLSFLAKYKLVTIREIKVLKHRNREAVFEHFMDILNSSDSDFRSKEETFSTYSDSNAVLILKSLKNPSDFLNLSPLIIDTRAEVIDSKEKFNLKKDIFIYTNYTDNRLNYAGTEVTDKCDLTNLSNYKDLVSDYEELMELIQNNKSKKADK